MNAKMKVRATLRIWAAIYPSITIFLYLFGEAMSSMPLYLRTLLLTATLVPWVVFAGVPMVDAVVRKIAARKRNPGF